MKKIFLTLAVLVMAVCANAQKNQYFWYQGNLMMGNPIAQIDSVTFGAEDTDSILIYLPRTIIKTVEVHDTVYITIHDTICPDAISEGALNGEFSVSATKKVRFSQGNLQFNAALGTHQCADGTTKQGTWRFAENQYDTAGMDNDTSDPTTSNWKDIFAWGTSGYNDCHPFVDYSASLSLYGGGDQAIEGTNYDWGIYCPIINGGNKAGLWFTLSDDEWAYLLQSRFNANQKYTLARVNSMNGMILLPDTWETPNGISLTVAATYESNILSYEEWQKLEKNGAIFLPAAGDGEFGYGNNSIFYEEHFNQTGFYWTSTNEGSISAKNIYISESLTSIFQWNWRHHHFSVRLVQEVK